MSLIVQRSQHRIQHRIRSNQARIRSDLDVKQFDSTTLSQLYQNFSDEVTFIMNPFVYSIDTALTCVEEVAPYPLEQQASLRMAKGPDGPHSRSCFYL